LILEIQICLSYHKPHKLELGYKIKNSFIASNNQIYINGIKITKKAVYELRYHLEKEEITYDIGEQHKWGDIMVIRDTKEK